MVEEIISDEVLVEGLRRGESEAFTQLWLKYGDNLISFLLSRGADPNDAADAAIDAVARAVEKIDQFDPQKGKGKAPFRNWLFTIARNLWHEQQRKKKGIVELDDEFLGDYSIMVLDDPSNAISETINKALSALPDNQRQTITMHFYDDLPLKQIAELMGVPEGTVRQWKKRALDTLRSELKDLPVLASLIDSE